MIEVRLVLFKDFEFRECKDTQFDKYELIKWQITSNDHRSCFTVGWIEYNAKASCWEFESCGLRYQEYYEEGLNEFVLKYVELLDLQRKYNDKDMEEFYEHY